MAPSSLRYVPYLRYYEEVLRDADVPYDVLSWDRFGDGDVRENARVHGAPGTATGLALLPGYAGYRRFLLRHLEAAKYETYVVLGTQMGVLLYDFLRRRRYILDVRDYSHEAFLPYRLVVRELVKRARVVCISSRGFLDWLPRHPAYVMSHNVSSRELRKAAAPFDRGRRVLASIGAIGYFEANAKFIRGMSRCGGHELRYIGHGTASEELRRYCEAQAVPGVSFQGAYAPEEKEGFYARANFVLGIYGTDSMVSRTLTPNRLYESCLYRRPLVVDEGTHLAQLVREKEIGAIVDLEQCEAVVPALSRYYDPEQFARYEERCEAFIAEVKSDVALFRDAVRHELLA